MKKKELYAIIILGISLLLIMSISLLKKDSDKIYKASGVVINSSTFKTAFLELTDNDKVVGTGVINSNIFWVDDKVNVEYTKNGKELTISKIVFVPDSRKDLAQVISHIGSDITMRKYRELIYGGYVDSKTNKKDNETIVEILALPEILSNQEYKLNFDPEEFVEIKGYSTSIYKEREITLAVKEEFEIIKFYNIVSGKKTEVNYLIENNDIKFDSFKEGIYLLKVQFTNGDIINYIFG